MKKKSSPGKRRKTSGTKRTRESTSPTEKQESQAITERFAAGFRGASLTDATVEQSLLLGRDVAAIEQIVGKDYAEKLRLLASQANQVRARGGRRVLVLPGILGSTLAIDGDTIWLDVIDIMRGRLKELSLDGASPKGESNGAFWPTYMELKLKLRIQGYQAEYFHFDWRKPIAEAGKRLALYVRSIASTSQPVSLVAHSMGGLVARAAMKLLGDESKTLLDQVILLGTPNFGSYAPALVLANDYSTVSWMEKLDFVSERTSLVKDVFASFVGLMEMLPEPSNSDGLDLFKTDNYPSNSSFGRANVLKAASGLQSRISIGNDRIWMIAGTGIDTVVGLEKKADNLLRFTQQVSNEGDGTVPLRLALLPNAQHRYCRVAHSSLPQSNDVIRATIDILANGTTKLLAASPSEVTRVKPSRSLQSPAPIVTENTDELQPLLQLNQAIAPFLSVQGEVDSSGAAISTTSQSDQFALEGLSQKPIVVGRKYQNRLDLTLLRGDVSDSRGRAIMLGIFKDVRPGGAAAAIDDKMGGLLADVIERRMFSANVGELFVIPASRQSLQTDMVVLIGLGNFSTFTAKSLRSSVENATRTLLRCHVDDLVTVTMGGGSGLSMRIIFESIVDGVQAAMKDAKDRLSLRSLTIATNNAADYDQLSSSALSLASSSRFDGLEFTIDHQIIEPKERSNREPGSSALNTQHSSSYLIVRDVPDPASTATDVRHLDVSLLGTVTKATVLSDQIVVDETKFKKLLQEIDLEQSKQSTFFSKIPALGQRLVEMVLPPIVREALIGAHPETLSVINDFWSSQIPWELMSLGDYQFSASGNLSRRYSTPNMSVAKWLYQRRASKEYKMLLVVDPTQDLSGAVEEGNRIREVVLKLGKIQLSELVGSDATKDRLSEAFSSGEYDVVHYAGHAYFDPNNRSQSGILCHNQQVLSGRDLSLLESLPTLMVFNACESGRVRAAKLPDLVAETEQTATKSSVSNLIDRNVSFAEAFLRGGVGSFLGTYWPVGDAAASIFAAEFYGKLLASASIGESLRAARTMLRDKNQPDYTNYIHYGDPEFRVKV